MTKQTALHAAHLALEKKAENIKILFLRPLTSIADYFVLCTGATDTHVRAIADHIAEQLELEEVRLWHIEGRERAHWILLDFVDFVVHVFQPETRQFYGLERLWGDAETEEIRDQP
ncbi:MAG: ribosome silencing factor [bacterium]